MPKQSKSESVPKEMQVLFEEISNLTDAFCKQHLNDEYAVAGVSFTHVALSVLHLNLLGILLSYFLTPIQTILINSALGF